jgi:hypothetical protein
MNREMLELAQKAIEEGWDAWKIMAEFCALQKKIDAKIALDNGSETISNKILEQ